MSYLTRGMGVVPSDLLPPVLSAQDLNVLGLAHSFKNAGTGFRMLVVRAASLAKYAKYHGTTWREIRADGGIMLELVSDGPVDGFDGRVDLSQVQERLKPSEEECIEKRVQEHMDEDTNLHEQVEQLRIQLDDISELLEDPHALEETIPVNMLLPEPGNYVNGPEFSMASWGKGKPLKQRGYDLEEDEAQAEVDEELERRQKEKKASGPADPEEEVWEALSDKDQKLILDELKHAIKQGTDPEEFNKKLRSERGVGIYPLGQYVAGLYYELEDEGWEAPGWGKGSVKKAVDFGGPQPRMVWQVSAEYPDKICPECKAKDGMEIGPLDQIPPLHKECKCQVVKASDYILGHVRHAAPAKTKTPRMPTNPRPKAPRKTPVSKPTVPPQTGDEPAQPKRKKKAPQQTAPEQVPTGFSVVDDTSNVDVPGTDQVQPQEPAQPVETQSQPSDPSQFALDTETPQPEQPAEQSEESTGQAEILSEEQRDVIAMGIETKPGQPPRFTNEAQVAITNYNGQLASSYGMTRSVKKPGTGKISLMPSGASMNTIFTSNASGGAFAYYNADGSIALQERMAVGLRNYADSNPAELAQQYPTILNKGVKKPNDPDLYNPLQAFHVMLHETIHDHGPRMEPLEGPGLMFDELCTELATRKITSDKHGLRLADIVNSYDSLINSIEMNLSGMVPEPQDVDFNDQKALKAWSEKERDIIYDAMASAALAIKSSKVAAMSPEDATALYAQHLAEKLNIDPNKPTAGYPSFTVKMQETLMQLMNW